MGRSRRSGGIGTYAVVAFAFVSALTAGGTLVAVAPLGAPLAAAGAGVGRGAAALLALAGGVVAVAPPDGVGAPHAVRNAQRPSPRRRIGAQTITRGAGWSDR
jgi:hypothetical protein